MNRTILHAVIAASIVSFASLPNFLAAAGDENAAVPMAQTGSVNLKEEAGIEEIGSMPVIVYELGDERFASLLANNKIGVAYDLNKEPIKTEPLSIEKIRSMPIITYDADKTKFSLDMKNVEVLEENLQNTDFAPSEYNLMWVNYTYSFTNVQKEVFTHHSFLTDANVGGKGYISINISGINNPVRISMYECESNTFVNSWEGNPKEVSKISFFGDVNTFYYFKFEPLEAPSISGFGEILWDN